MGFAQQAYPVGPVQICVFGDEGARKGSPTSLLEKLCRFRAWCSLRTKKDGAALCEWLRMKFSAGFLQWEPTEAARGYESNRPTRDV
jgi:hypothetical protein